MIIVIIIIIDIYLWNLRRMTQLVYVIANLLLVLSLSV
jgi:hypothetical protein